MKRKQKSKKQSEYIFTKRTNEVLIDIVPERNSKKEASSFFDLPKVKICRDPSHHAPGYICIPEGKGYKHVCPSCGHH